MKTKMIAFLTVILLTVLTGCNNAPPNEDKTQPFSFSESVQSIPESEAPAVNESKEVETTPEAVQGSEPEKQKETTEKDTVSTEQPQTVSDTEQAGQPAAQLNEADKTDNPSSTPQPSVPEQTESKAPDPPKIEEMPSETKPDFDIDYWISFAKGYAESVGLELDSEAVYCWDNPLGADAHSKYLERDITDCLNRYAKDEDITAVWVWAESIGDNTFELYIGYA